MTQRDAIGLRALMLGPMDQDPGALVVPTPERVAFEYAVAGVGSRFLAQCIDVLVQGGLVALIVAVATTLGAWSREWRVGVLVFLGLGFLLFVGYFPVFEGLWSGQTPGKRALRLRVVGDGGAPLRWSQVAIRNLIRFVDFLPILYGIGLLVLFVNAQGKRLGDLAAGTVVVRERDRVTLRELRVRTHEPRATPSGAASIWSTPATPGAASPDDSSALRNIVSPPPASDPPPLEPGLKRFVGVYAERRRELPLERRRALAESVEPALRRVLPELVATRGALTALEHLADLEAGR